MDSGDDERRVVFLEVRDPGVLVNDLDSGRGLFVPTRLPLTLSSTFILGVRLRNVSRSIELPMQVVGRRLPRGRSLLSAGVIAKLTEDASPMLEILRDVAGGRLVDLESRLQEQVRVPVKSHFTTAAEAIVELRALFQDARSQGAKDGDPEPPARGHFPVDQLVQRGDRLALTIMTEDRGLLLTPHVLVRSVHMLDGRRCCLAELIDDHGRALVEQFLVGMATRSARA